MCRTQSASYIIPLLRYYLHLSPILQQNATFTSWKLVPHRNHPACDAAKGRSQGTGQKQKTLAGSLCRTQSASYIIPLLRYYLHVSPILQQNATFTTWKRVLPWRKHPACVAAEGRIQGTGRSKSFAGACAAQSASYIIPYFAIAIYRRFYSKNATFTSWKLVPHRNHPACIAHKRRSQGQTTAKPQAEACATGKCRLDALRELSGLK
ncbi:MAG: hypothetical protein Q9P14_10100 [candidate division KSB1 bacterium]|nr:hypothetical protein [candidate division KSB1 bacterium]